MKIEVSVRITEKSGYDWNEVASAKLETNAPWEDVKPTAIHRALDSAVEDVLDRVAKQLKAEHTKRREAERELDAA